MHDFLLWTTLVLTVTFHQIARRTRYGFLLLLPGVFLHELCHFALALLTLSRPGWPSLWPREITPGHIVTGSVTFTPGLLTGASVALAPLLLMPWAFLYVWHHALPIVLPYPHFWRALLLAQILNTLWPSRQDWHIAITHPASLGILLTCLWLSAH